jgi:hypothetical protein
VQGVAPFISRHSAGKLGHTDAILKGNQLLHKDGFEVQDILLSLIQDVDITREAITGCGLK